MNVDLLNAEIEAGVYDKDLETLHKKIGDRLTRVRDSRSISSFKIGDRVVINDYCGTKYLRGAKATVVSLARTKLTIKLDMPIGRFSTTGADGRVSGAEVKVPPSIIDHVR